MITPVNILLIIIWGIMMPFILGYGVKIILHDMNKISVAENISFGFALMCAVFQLYAVPMIFMHIKFHVLKITWIITTLIIALLSCVVIYKYNRFKAEFEVKSWCGELKKDRMTLFVWIAAILVIAFETYLLTVKMHIDTDDSRFLAEALEAVEQDTMLLVHPITGKFYDVAVGEQMKDITAPYPIFLGLIGELLRMHPTVAAHTILPLLFIPFCYVVYSLVGRELFGNKAKEVGIFILFLGLIQLFSFETIYSSGYTLLTIIWQGRSVVAVIILPLLWYVLLRVTAEEHIDKAYYVVIFIVSIAASMLSNMGSLLSFLLVFAYAVVNGAKRKEFSVFALMCMSSIPSATYVLLEKVLVHSSILYKLM